MFDLRLKSNIQAINSKSIEFSNGTSCLIPHELRNLCFLSSQWQSSTLLSKLGLPAWQQVRLLSKGIIECGLEDITFPLHVRTYFEKQFPKHAVALPFTEWLTGLEPRILWLGLPHANLVDLRHSTASGLAAVIDSLPTRSTFLGVLPEISPSMRCARDLSSISRLANTRGITLGVLGGDHSVTWSLLSVLKKSRDIHKVRYIHIDAHHDLYGIDVEKEQGVFHSNFLADLLANQDVDQVRLIGCRDQQTQIRYAKKMGYDIDFFDLSDGICNQEMHTHMSIDIDILDPDCFTGVSSPLPGGWSFEELVSIVSEIHQKLNIDSVSIVETGSNCRNTIVAAKKIIELLEQLHG